MRIARESLFRVADQNNVSQEQRGVFEKERIVLQIGASKDLDYFRRPQNIVIGVVAKLSKYIY